LTDETRSLIDKNAMRKMKKGHLNQLCSRGIINEKDFMKPSGREVAGAALDVFEKEHLLGILFWNWKRWSALPFRSFYREARRM